MRIGTGNLVEVTPRPLPMPRKSFEFPSHPLHKIPVEVPPQLTQCRRVEATIAGLPTTEFRIEHLRQIQQRLLVLELDMPATHASIDLLLRGDTDRRKKVRVNLPFLVHTPSRTESVTKEIKADSRMLFQAIHILAIDDRRFVGMDLQPTLTEAFRDKAHHVFRLRLALAVQQPIVGVSTKWNPRQLASHPRVKRVVQEQICQNRGSQLHLAVCLCRAPVDCRRAAQVEPATSAPRTTTPNDTDNGGVTPS